MKSTSFLPLLLLVAVSFTLIAGCNSSSAPPPPPPPIITVSVSAATSQVEAGGTVVLTGNAAGDPANRGVIWSILPASGAGNLSNTTPFSGTYNAPAAPPPSDLSVTITATSLSDSTKSSTVNIDVPPPFSSPSRLPSAQLRREARRKSPLR